MPEIVTSVNAPMIALPTPQLDNTFTLAGALQKRQTNREFSAQALSHEILSAILWCAFGVNRPQSGGRTAPSARNWQEIDVYVVMSEGTYRYEAREHALSLVLSADLRAATGTQDFVGVAPLNLVYIADFDKMTDTTPERRILYSAADTGMIVQNVYLYCAALGLACVVRGLVDRDKLKSVLGLRTSQQIILAHTVGYAK